jgi:catechol-2,3-dioxygenase
MERSLPEAGTQVVPIRFAHFVLRTRKLPELREWWQTMLQARVVFENEFICFMTYDDEHHRIALASLPDLAERPESAVGTDHVAYTYANLGDLLYTHQRLAAQGIEPYWCINHGPTTSMYYRDPEGNQVELQVDNFADSESLHAWFRSGAFAENPIGVPFDPEQLRKRWLEGEPESELVKQGAG